MGSEYDVHAHDKSCAEKVECCDGLPQRFPLSKVCPLAWTEALHTCAWSLAKTIQLQPRMIQRRISSDRARAGAVTGANARGLALHDAVTMDALAISPAVRTAYRANAAHRDRQLAVAIGSQHDRASTCYS